MSECRIRPICLCEDWDVDNAGDVYYVLLSQLKWDKKGSLPHSLRAAVRVFQGKIKHEVGGENGITTKEHITWMSDKIRKRIERLGLWHRLLSFAIKLTGTFKVWAEALDKEMQKLRTHLARLLAPVM
jgi:hypothetical protein